VWSEVWCPRCVVSEVWPRCARCVVTEVWPRCARSFMTEVWSEVWRLRCVVTEVCRDRGVAEVCGECQPRCGRIVRGVS